MLYNYWRMWIPTELMRVLKIQAYQGMLVVQVGDVHGDSFSSPPHTRVIVPIPTPSPSFLSLSPPHYRGISGCSNGGPILSVTLDNRLSMDKHVNEVSRTCFYHLRALRHIRPAITVSNANMIACSVVGLRLDYANAVLYGASSKNINHLQRIQNALARCVLDSKAYRSSDALIYIRYTGCPSVIVLTLNLWNSRSSLVHLLPARTLTHQSLDTCHLALSALRILNFSPFLEQRQSSVRARSVLLHAPTVFNYLPQDIRSTDNIYASWRRFISAMPSINTIATSSAPQIEHMLLTLHTWRNYYLLIYTLLCTRLPLIHKCLDWTFLIKFSEIATNLLELIRSIPHQ